MRVRRKSSRQAISAAVVLAASATAAVFAFATEGSAARRGPALSNATSGTLVVNINPEGAAAWLASLTRI